MDRVGMIANSAALLVLGLAGAATRADASNWGRELRYDPQSNQSSCVLVSATHRIHDGYQDTPVHLELDEEALRVISDSNFDTTGDPPDLSVDGGAFIPADAVVGATKLAFTRERDTIVEQFINGSTAQLRLRFWPTWPATGDKNVTFSLRGFTRAYRSTCD
jgi:hypothetical protein